MGRNAAITLILLALLAFTSCGEKYGELRVLTYNIHAGIGMDGRLDLERLAGVINGIAPDIVGLQEVDSATTRSELKDQAAELGRLTGMHAVFGPAIDHAGGKYGVAILSREKPLNHYNIPLPGAEERRTLLVAEFEGYVVFNTHLSLTESSRMESLEIMFSETEKYEKPVIITGDFNAVPGSMEITLIKENWLPLSGTSLKTFPSEAPEVTLDYIFGAKMEKGFKESESRAVYEPVASDHLPLYANIKFIKK